MTPAEIRTARHALGLTQGQAARLAGVDGRTWRRWEEGSRDMPQTAQRILRLMTSETVRRALDAMDNERPPRNPARGIEETNP